MKIMQLSKKAFFVIIAILCNIVIVFGQQQPPDPLAYNVQPFDVLHYDVMLDLRQSPPSRQTNGICRIYVVWKENPEKKVFMFHLRSLTIDSVQSNGIKIESKVQGKENEATFHYTVAAPDNAKVGDTTIYTVWYKGIMTDEYGSGSWGGVSSSDSTVYALGVGFQANYVSTTQHWMPCYDHPSDKATYKGTFLVKKGIAVASNGLLKKRDINDSLSQYEWTHNYPCATYLLTFSAAPYMIMEFGDDTLQMMVFARRRDTSAVRTSFRLLPRMAATYSRLFGEYPFEKIGYCLTQKGAMEHQTMIAYNTSLAQSKDTVNPVAAHELAHQWFGDLVSPIDFRHAWLNESFATYCESAWYEELFGFDKGFITNQHTKSLTYINTILKNEKALPLYDYSRTAPSSNYPETIYQKGAVVLGMLRYAIGTENFYKTMRRYLQTYSYRNASTDSLQRIIEEVTGKSMTDFFRQWIYQKGIPEIKVIHKNTDDSTKEITISQVQNAEYGTYTNMPIEIGFVRKNGQPTLYTMVTVNKNEEVFTITHLPTDIDRITINQGPTTRTLVRVQSIVDITSIAENSPTDDDMSISPIPANGFITIKIHNPQYNGLSIINQQGTVFPWNNNTISESDTIRIDTRDWLEGLYFIRINYPNGAISKPVLIMRD